jgi:hypothetical protein
MLDPRHQSAFAACGALISLTAGPEVEAPQANNQRSINPFFIRAEGSINPFFIRAEGSINPFFIRAEGSINPFFISEASILFLSATPISDTNQRHQ